MLVLLAVLVLTQAGLGRPAVREGPPGVNQESPAIVASMSFEVGIPHSGFALSTDGRALYFTEGGAQGSVLKRVDLAKGSVGVSTLLRGKYVNVAAIPGDTENLVLGEASGWSERAFKVAVVNVGTGEERLLDVGEAGNGHLLVSPSGTYIETGVDYQCHSGGRDRREGEEGYTSINVGSFFQSRGGRVSGFLVGERVVAISESPAKDGLMKIEVVVLR